MLKMEERVLSALKHVLHKRDKITLDSRLLEDLNVDSIEMVMIIGDLEDEFEITIADGDFADVVTVADIVEKLRAVEKLRVRVLSYNQVNRNLH